MDPGVRTEDDGHLLAKPEPESPHLQLPHDLPTSLNDRKPMTFDPVVEVYDPWQGQSQFLTAPTPAKTFTLSLDDPNYKLDYASPGIEDKDTRFNQMVAAQAAYRDIGSRVGDENKIACDEQMSDSDKKETLQRVLFMAASNGDLERLQQLLTGATKTYVDVNLPDEDGTTPLIFASCFGHDKVVQLLLDAGADVDIQDRHQWSSLMWAAANSHKNTIKILLEHGASPEARSSSGRTAFDFVVPHSEVSDYLHDNGYKIGSIGVADDFYSSGISQDRFEEEMAESEMKRRMMMESAINLEVDLGNLGLDEQPESPGELEEEDEFVWDKCLNDQMFVFQESELERVLDITITNMTPQRSPSQKPIPANVLFLCARYAHYHANPALLETFLVTAMKKVNNVVERHQWDMTILAFWISNATLLLHYLRKDTALLVATSEFQSHISELINEIFILIVRDAERRMEKLLDTAMLDYESIPGFENVHFQNEWKLFRSKAKVNAPEPINNRYRPSSPRRKAKIAPRNIISLLSSTLFVLDLYDIHSVITTQILAQLLYWLGAELFNRTMSNRKYLARTKAMQIRMNISMLEEWSRSNNRYPEHYENGSMNTTGETTIEASRQHLAPVIQLLQWLQSFSTLGDKPQVLQSTVQQLPRLSSHQLIHAVKYYRAEVGENGLPKSAMTYLYSLPSNCEERKAKQTENKNTATPRPHISKTPSNGTKMNLSPDTDKRGNDEDEPPENLLLDSVLMLPFVLPTSTDMLISFGAGFGGVNREKARKYVPTVPPEFLMRLDAGTIQMSKSYDNTS